MKPYEELTVDEKLELVKVHVLYNGAVNSVIMVTVLAIISFVAPYTWYHSWFPALLFLLSVPGLARAYLDKNEAVERIRGK